jgi:dihydropyrimidinase
VKVYVETCPQYLLLDDSVYNKDFDESAKFVCSPPIRRHEDQAALWNALRHGELDTIATDHCSFTARQKRAGADDFTKIPNGMPGLETRAVLLYTYGVRKKRITLPQLCAYLSERPAKLYGMYPKKGAIKVGSDADIVVFDPKDSGVITAQGLHSSCGYTPFEGVATEGRIDRVYLRGQVVYTNGEIVLEHSGRYVTRGTGTLNR